MWIVKRCGIAARVRNRSDLGGKTRLFRQSGKRLVSAMHKQDLSQNRRIARLTQLTLELEQSRTPEETLRILERGFAEVGGFVASLLLSTRGLSPGHYRVVAPS